MSLVSEMIETAIARSERAWRKSPNYYPDRRFPDFGISKPAAKRIAAAAGVKTPRPGWQVDVEETTWHGHHGHWVLFSHSGTFKLRFQYSA